MKEVEDTYKRYFFFMGWKKYILKMAIQPKALYGFNDITFKILR